MPDLQITVEDAPNGSAKVIRCEGNIDAHTCPDLDKTISKLLSEGVTALLLDLSAVPYMASRGLGVLVNARKQVEDRNGSMIMFGVGEAVMDAITVLGFDAIFTIVATEQDATAALS